MIDVRHGDVLTVRPAPELVEELERAGYELRQSAECTAHWIVRRKETRLMDSEGEIYSSEEVARMAEDRRAELEPIPPGEEANVRSMSRRERRAWYARKRRARRRHLREERRTTRSNS